MLGHIVGSLAQIMFEEQFQKIMGRKKVEKMIDALRNQYSVRGFERMGALICRGFAANPLPFVAVEKVSDISEKLEGLITGDSCTEHSSKPYSKKFDNDGRHHER